MYVCIDVFKEEQFDFKFGQWCAENFIENGTVVLLFGVSPPLVVATEDYDMQFLTHEHYSGTGKSKSVHQKYG